MTTHANGTARPPLARGERVLLLERDATGGLIVATTDAIYCREDNCGSPTGDRTDTGWRRLGWAETGRVDWEPGREVLHLCGVAAGAPADLVVALAHRSALVALCRERVGATILACCRVHLANGTTALVQARRRLGSPVPAWVVLANGDLADGPAGATADAELAAAIRHLRAELGGP